MQWARAAGAPGGGAGCRQRPGAATIRAEPEEWQQPAEWDRCPKDQPRENPGPKPRLAPGAETVLPLSPQDRGSTLACPSQTLEGLSWGVQSMEDAQGMTCP